ncbi:MAG TPA: ATP-binding protein [Xanthobacteraceae bacterium]|jgi:two-component system phosphate regulon sensor histidine kinase PhoR
MNVTQEAARRRTGQWWGRLRYNRVRFALISAALVLAGFWVADLIPLLPALACYALVVTAAVIGRGTVEAARVDGSQDEAPASRLGNPRIEAVLSGLPDPVVALDERGEVVAVNAPMIAMAPALRRGEAVSLGLRNPEVIEAIRRASAAGTLERVEFFVRVPVERWYEATVMPVQIAASEGAKPERLLLATFHDLTPLRRVEEMRADFVANASHELRTPLAALSGFIETLRGPARDDPSARDRFLAIMQAQATRMARLIDDLLSLSRIELNAHLRPDKAVDLVPIIRQVVDGLQMLASDRGVDVQTNVPPGRLLVLGDRDELLRAIENLVENALKYAASGKRVEIWLTVAEGVDATAEARIAVKDYGPGIPPEHLPRLTERFYRVDVAESRAQGGTGLGLALVKHILNRHGGRLSIESAVGQGATFTAHLPLRRAIL